MALSQGHNIVVFGQTGSGKSSLINMLARKEVAGVSNAVFGATPSNKEYTVLAPGAIPAVPLRAQDVPSFSKDSTRKSSYPPTAKTPDHAVQRAVSTTQSYPLQVNTSGGSKALDSSWYADVERSKLPPAKRLPDGSSISASFAVHSPLPTSKRTSPLDVVDQCSPLRIPFKQKSCGFLSPSNNSSSLHFTANSRSDSTLPSSDVYRFWDTAGLNEDERGTVPPAEAYANLIKLARDTGLNLILYCVRASRFTESVRVNYDLFWKIICDRQVPIVLVVTGLEQEEDMDAWWEMHKADFERMGMTFAAHACVTTIRGKDKIYNREYRRSREKVWEAIKEHCAPEVWQMKKQPKAVIAEMERYMKHHNARTSRRSRVQECLRTLGRFFGRVAK